MVGFAGAGAGAVLVLVLVLDPMVLSHFTIADRLDVLQNLLIDADCRTTQVVIKELRAGARASTVPTG
ncbi:hypothetical protein GA0070607_5493 [Micromonospora coriariae]|uniref:Uncharacterized protein n=1 Tax=Micromonospora coriariae TaxID=285665 RepID=A0A1C4XM80_9ACTN|nr:hypothetical protein [Micromonospora coriariae]SCF09629.1 hypothetical protein GA0070607_5493 [Micromonospora coriariae]